MTDDFHRYGVEVDERETAFFFDGVELRRVPTPPEAHVPLYLLVNLALGSGWPTKDTPDSGDRRTGCHARRKPRREGPTSPGGPPQYRHW